MPVTNSDVASIFEQVADLLDIQGANEFRVRSYRTAAQTISSLSRSVTDIVEAGDDLTGISGIGDDLAGKITEIVETGSLDQLQDLEQEVPPDLAEMLRLPALGPKRVATLREELEIDAMEKLEEAAVSGRISEVEGFGEKTREKILEGLEGADEDERTKLAEADQLVEPVLDWLEEGPGVDRIVVAGSYRRRKETVGDLDILATASDGEKLIAHFVEYDNVEDVISQGETRSSVTLRSGLQVDLRVVPEESYGAALLYFTGSKDHNVALRKIAVDEGIKLNEYGAFRTENDNGEDGNGGNGDEHPSDEARIAGETEEELYELFDLPYIVPELRENRGELDAAAGGELPDLIERGDIRGDLHMHTTDSDGRASIEEMAEKAVDLGYDYIAVTDHSDYLGVYDGLDEDDLAAQGERIDELNDEVDEIIILKGCEVDVLADGSLALDDDALETLDVVVASAHTKLDLSRDKQTERFIRAMDHPAVTIIGHPTGRILGERHPCEVDLERLVEEALERGVFLELNGQPSRLDMDDIHLKMARDKGLPVPISTDAHDTHHLDFMRFGIDQARRGWLEKDDVLNTRSLKQLREFLDR